MLGRHREAGIRAALEAQARVDGGCAAAPAGGGGSVAEAVPFGRGRRPVLLCVPKGSQLVSAACELHRAKQAQAAARRNARSPLARASPCGGMPRRCHPSIHARGGHGRMGVELAGLTWMPFT